MKITKRIYFLTLALAMVVMSGCDNYFDINKDPNNPSTVTLGQLLTQSQLTVVNSFGIGNPGMSTPASILVHQTVQRGSMDSYVVSGDDFQIQTAWQNLYSGAIVDLKTIIDNGTKDNSMHYVGIAKVMMAYTYSLMVDLWGDVPFSQAADPTNFLYPEYDDDATIYPALIAMLDDAIANLEADATQDAGTDDLIYGGDTDAWRKLAKTIKLKLYNQTRLVQDVSAPVNALLSEGDLLEEGEDFELAYGTSVAPDNRNPAFVLEYTIGSRPTYVSPYFYEIMTNKSTLNPVLSGIADPRVPYYWFNQLTDPGDAQNPVEFSDTNGFLSIHFASQGVNQGWQQDRSQTVLGLYPIGGRFDDGAGGEVNTAGAITGPGTVAQRLLPYFSSLYIQAELALTVAGVSGNARTLFQSAMQASFDKVNAIASDAGVDVIEDEDVEDYLTAVLAKYDAASASGKLELIMTEKWIASFGFSIDSYTDYRRTGYPIMYDPNADDLPYTLTSRLYPVSLAWNSQSVILNQNAPQQKTVTTDRVFWDPN